MIDLSTRYLGLRLRSPLVHSASPLSRQIENIRKLEDAGIAAVVMHSLFEEEIDSESRALHTSMSRAGHRSAEAIGYFPDLPTYDVGPEEYLELIGRAKQAVDVPIIGSLNGASSGGWIDYAHKIAEAGADALELNIYFIAADTAVPGCEIEQMYFDLISNVRASIKIPLAVKLSPFFTNFAHVARRIDDMGVDGLVLFNRFYQPDIDLENLTVKNDLHLSSPAELRLRLRWAAILFGRVRADLAVTGGVHGHKEVLKSMMVGARVAMMTSAILSRGPEHLRTVEQAMVRWMEEHEYESIEQMQGSMSQRSVADPAAFERAHYMKVLHEFTHSGGIDGLS